MADHKINIRINAKDKTRGTLKRVSSGFKKLAASIAAYISARAVIGFAKSTIDAFMAQEDAVNSLSAALSKNGEDVSALIPKYQKFAAAVQTVTKFGDEGTLEIMAYGKNLGIATEQLEDATKAAVGLAAKFKLDLRTAMMLVGRASQGQTQMLTRYGIALDDTLDEQGKFNALLKIGASNFRLASAEAGTLAGRLEQAKNAYGDMKENIGAAVTEAFELTTVLDNLSLSIQAASEAGDFKAMAEDMRILKDALSPVAKAFGNIRDTVKAISGWLGAATEVTVQDFKGLMRGDLGEAFTVSAEQKASMKQAFQTGMYESQFRRSERERRVGELREKRAATLEELTGGDATTLGDVKKAVEELKTK